MRLRTAPALVVTAALLVGCAADPPLLSAPPAPDDVEAWPTVTWAEAEVPPPDRETLTNPVAVVSGPGGFVAAGSEDVGPDRSGLLWWSADGASWTAVGGALLEGLDIVDIAAAPIGYAAIAQSLDPTETVFLFSADGRSWQRADPPVGVAGAYGHTIAGSERGFLAAGADPSVAAVWRSADGLTWEALPGDDVTKAGVTDLAATPNGWVALVDATGSAAIASSVDGTEWSSVALPTVPDEQPEVLVPGQDGWLIRGLVGSCGFLSWGSCAAGPANWWSADGTTWGRMPVMPPLDGPPVPEVSTGPRGFVAWSTGEAWSSPDGWAWTRLGGPEDPTFGPAAIASTDDRIVLVGSTTSADGERTVGRAFLGVPD